MKLVEACSNKKSKIKNPPAIPSGGGLQNLRLGELLKYSASPRQKTYADSTYN